MEDVAKELLDEIKSIFTRCIYPEHKSRPVCCNPDGSHKGPRENVKNEHVKFTENFKIVDLTEWDEYFLKIARVVATKSKDPHTQCGSVIVDRNKSIISTGYNSYVRGMKDHIHTVELGVFIEPISVNRIERPEKYYWIEHAERNAIYNAASKGISIESLTMYNTTPIPCTGCMRGIINSGIKTIFVSDQDWPEWREDAARSYAMAKECNLTVNIYNYDSL